MSVAKGLEVFDEKGIFSRDKNVNIWGLVIAYVQIGTGGKGSSANSSFSEAILHA